MSRVTGNMAHRYVNAVAGVFRALFFCMQVRSGWCWLAVVAGAATGGVGRADVTAGERWGARKRIRPKIPLGVTSERST